VPWLGYACGTCKYCLTGWETLCLAQENTGYSVDGCYAEYFLAPAAFATHVPVGIDPREAAPLACAGVTTYKAVKVGNVRPGDLVGHFRRGRAGAQISVRLAFMLAAHNHDRARRVMHAVLADRAKQRLGQPAVTPGAHHEQVGSLSCGYQHLPGLALRHVRANLNIRVDGAHPGYGLG
jgi:D-arabinose 1-dehydrogenase-like Zn-dependent alcohol dehydrogenase